MTRIVISNVYADDNRGGAAITSATIALVRRAFPNCEIGLVPATAELADPSDFRHTQSSHPDVRVLPPAIDMGHRRTARKLALIQSAARLLMRRPPNTDTARWISTSDLVVGKGGQLFRARSWRGLAGLWLLAYPLLLAHVLGRRTAVYAVAVGPFGRHRAARRLSAFVLRRVDVVLVRDAESYREVLAMRGPTGLHQVPDSVFAVEPPSDARSATVTHEFGFAGSRFAVVTIGDNLANSPARPRIFSNLAAVLAGLYAADLIDRTAVVLQTDGRTASDRSVSADFVRYCGDPRTELVDRDVPPEDLMAFYAAAVLTIGGRVHSNIFSIVAGTPAFPLDAHTRKAEEVFDTFGYGERCLRIAEKDPQDLLATILSVLSDGETARADVRRVRDELRRNAGVAEALLRPALGT